MSKLKIVAVAALLALSSGIASAQSVGNSGQPGRANTTDPNSAPMTGSSGMRREAPAQGTVGLDAAGRSNTTDPNSAMSGGTNASGRTADPMANSRQR